jgi:hypothetical protein
MDTSPFDITNKKKKKSTNSDIISDLVQINFRIYLFKYSLSQNTLFLASLLHKFYH